MIRYWIGWLIYRAMLYLPQRWLTREIYYGNGTLCVEDTGFGRALWRVAFWSMGGNQSPVALSDGYGHSARGSS